MESGGEVSEFSSLFELERVFRNSLLLLFIVGISSETEEEDGHRDSEAESSRTEGIILINPHTQSMVVIEGPPASFDSLFQWIGAKSGQPPASKESIEAMPGVEVREGEEDGECAICLEKWVCWDLLKEMPCKHRFHGGCIEKWLKIHGSCPVCRFEMPVEGKKKKEKKNGDGRSSDDSDSDQLDQDS